VEASRGTQQQLPIVMQLAGNEGPRQSASAFVVVVSTVLG
jgi:hypothetical protein